MKRQISKSLLLLLVLMCTMYNCKKKDADPLEPNSGLVDELDKITLPEIELTEPTPVNSTAGSITVSPKTAEIGNALNSTKESGQVSDGLKNAAADITASLSTGEIAALAAVTDEQINAIAAGGALPAELKSVLDRVAADPKLQGYLPTFTLPTVDGKPVAARTGDVVKDAPAFPDLVVEVNDECIAKANELYNKKKAQLEAAKATAIEAISKSYENAVAKATADEASCKAGIPAKYEKLRDDGIALANLAFALLDAVRPILGDALYATLKALTTVQLLGYLSTLNNLQAAELKACSDTAAAAIARAQAARDANIAKVEAAFQNALAAANELRLKMIESCHNQGGGN